MGKSARLSIILSVIAITATVLGMIFVHCCEFKPQEKKAEVRFMLNETMRIIENAKTYTINNPGNFLQTIALSNAESYFNEGFKTYEREQYDKALVQFKKAREEVLKAFPPEEIKPIYYPLIPYPMDEPYPIVK